MDQHAIKFETHGHTSHIRLFMIEVKYETARQDMYIERDDGEGYGLLTCHERLFKNGSCLSFGPPTGYSVGPAGRPTLFRPVLSLTDGREGYLRQREDTSETGVTAP